MHNRRETDEELFYQKDKIVTRIALLGAKIQSSIFSGINDDNCRKWENEIFILKQELIYIDKLLDLRNKNV